MYDAGKNQIVISLRDHDEPIDQYSFKGTRLLSDIYNRCNVAIFEPAGDSEAAKDPEMEGCNGGRAQHVTEKLNMRACA